MFIFWSEFIIYLGFAAVIGTFVDRFVNFVKEIRYYYLEETGASVDKPTKRILWGFVFSISFSIYIYMNCVIVTTPHNDSVKIPKALSDHPCHQTIEQIVFVDSEGVTLPGEIFCPYVRPYVFPKNHMDVSYIINGDSDNVRYSDY